MAKKSKQPSQKSVKKSLLKEIKTKLAESLDGLHKKVSEKKFEKKIHQAGKILSKFLVKEKITVAHKKKIKTPKKDNKEAVKEVAP